jgi:hypothetical protein
MIYKNIKQEFEYILWLRTRIQKITFGISRRVKTDSTTDFLLLTRKLKSYQEEFKFVTNELNSLLTNDSLLTKTDNIGQESGALPIRDAYCDWQEEETKKARQKANQTGGGGRSQKQRRLGI